MSFRPYGKIGCLISNSSEKWDFIMYGSSRKKLRLSFNAPVTLVFAALCVAVRLADKFTGGAANRLLFSVYRAPLDDPLTWVRCVTYVLGHVSWDHLIGNMMYILLLGPVIEEKYGSKNTAAVIAVSAAVTGTVSMLFFPRVILYGASGVAFAFILIAAVAIREDGAVPVTFILVAILYLGREVYDGILVRDNVSQTAHIVGGLVGAVLGFLLDRKKKKDHF